MLIAAAFALGLVIGSFLNVVIHRVPLQIERGWRRDALDFLGQADDTAPVESVNLLFPPSRCPRCRQPLRFWHNIPVLSFLLLRGRCRHCAAPISMQYPLVELSCGLLTALILHQTGTTAAGLWLVLLTWCLIALTGIDFKHQLLPDIITLPLLWLGLLANLSATFTTLSSAVIGAMLGYLSLWSIFWAFKLLTGKDGMGHGDFKLLAALGAWAGWQQVPAMILLSSVLGAVVGIIGVLLRGRDRRVPIAFGPYLAVAGWLVLMAQAVTGTAVMAVMAVMADYWQLFN